MKAPERLIRALKQNKLSLALAESVTGGFTSYLLTGIAGSSKVFKGGIVVYSLDAKNNLFKISTSLLKKAQGVSKDVSHLLAKKVRKIFKADIGASIVGFAGPQARKGVKIGTIFISVTSKKDALFKKIILKGNRDTIRKKASYRLIELIYECVALSRSKNNF